MKFFGLNPLPNRRKFLLAAIFAAHTSASIMSSALALSKLSYTAPGELPGSNIAVTGYAASLPRPKLEKNTNYVYNTLKNITITKVVKCMMCIKYVRLY